MKNFLKYVAALAIVGAFFVACSDWTDPEREITQHPDQQSPILRDNAYYQALREYKKTKHKIAFGCLFAAQPSGQLHRLIQQLPRLPGEALIPSFAECVPNAHLPGSYLPYCPVAYPVASRNSIAPAGEKKSELCVAPAQKRTER